jgi:hypothetical protein
MVGRWRSKGPDETSPRVELCRIPRVVSHSGSTDHRLSKNRTRGRKKKTAGFEEEATADHEDDDCKQHSLFHYSTKLCIISADYNFFGGNRSNQTQGWSGSLFKEK